MKKEDRIAWQLHVKATKDQFSTNEMSLGPWSSYSLIHDPKHMCFVLARYKFCAKMLAGKGRVLEIGCGDGFGIPIVAQHVGSLHCVDWERRVIEGNPRRLCFLQNVTYEEVDVSKKPPRGTYDAAFSIDVLEHLEPDVEDDFMGNVLGALLPAGVLIIGTPNKTASEHATARSEIQHINLKTSSNLRELMDTYFENSFIFSMNDEIVHTGYYPMAHYLIAVGVGKRDR
jgi:2-polyprenyl-3-methyl-5-hydroxy-6-metoxy-1,4-benzoquinol methylase